MDAWEWTPRRETVHVGIVEVACRVWEADDAIETVILIHGNGARGEWWDGVGPLLARGRRVVTLDLSGHGLTTRREEYEYEGWIDEVVAVADAFASERAALVGHSMGGLVALRALLARPGRFAGVIALDSPLRRYGPGELEKRLKIASRPAKRYPTRGEAVAGFAVVPPLARPHESLVAHVAEHSYVATDGAWVHHADPRVFARVTDVSEFHRPYPERTWWVRADRGLIDDEGAAELREFLPYPDRLITLPNATHNFVLEHPTGTAWLVESILSRLFEAAED